MQMMDDAKQRDGATRRRGLGTSLKVALAAPAVLAALPLGTAAADDNHDNDDNDEDREDDLEQELEDVVERLHNQGVTGLQRMSLLKVSDVNTGGDFDKGNAASSQDPLTRGTVRVVRASGNNAGLVQVVLVEAAANVAYGMAFIRFNDHGREGLGNVRTDGNGNFSGPARVNSDNTGDPVHLGGNDRMGAFVLTRDGKDEFVSGFLTS